MKQKIMFKNNKTASLPENVLMQKQIQLQSKKDSLTFLKQQQQTKLDSISAAEIQIEQINEQTKEQKELNKKVRKNRLILMLVVFLLAVIIEISFGVFLNVTHHNKLMEYSSVIAEKESEYEYPTDSSLE